MKQDEEILAKTKMWYKLCEETAKLFLDLFNVHSPPHPPTKLFVFFNTFYFYDGHEDRKHFSVKFNLFTVNYDIKLFSSCQQMSVLKNTNQMGDKILVKVVFYNIIKSNLFI